jgi:UDP-4-amino-4,6-dideoxy-N-acetyl-beta-L-altrosamine N-acetyltransferase
VAVFENIPYKDLVAKNFTSLSDDEIEKVLSWRNHPDIRKWMHYSQIIPLESHYQFVNKLKTDSGNLYYFVKNQVSSEELGVIYINKIDSFNKSGEFGIYKNPDLSAAKGIGKELALLEIYIAFQKLGLKVLTLEVHTNNTVAINLYEKIGFSHIEEREGFLRMKLINHEPI